MLQHCNKNCVTNQHLWHYDVWRAAAALAFLGGRPSLTSPVLTGFCKISVNLRPIRKSSSPLTFQPTPICEVNKCSLSGATWGSSHNCLHFTSVLFHLYFYFILFFITIKLNPVTKNGDIHSESKYQKTNNSNAPLTAISSPFVHSRVSYNNFTFSHGSIKTKKQKTWESGQKSAEGADGGIALVNRKFNFHLQNISHMNNVLQMHHTVTPSPLPPHTQLKVQCQTARSEPSS